MAIKNVTILHEQTLFDVVLQYYGSVSKVYDFIKLNRPTIPNIMFNSLKGLTVKYEEQTDQVSQYFKSNEKDITTKYPQYASSPFSETFIVAVGPTFTTSVATNHYNPPSSL